MFTPLQELRPLWNIPFISSRIACVTLELISLFMGLRIGLSSLFTFLRMSLNRSGSSSLRTLMVSDEPEANSVEISPNITAELNDTGELIGIEIINASSFLRDLILESVQGKLLTLEVN